MTINGLDHINIQTRDLAGTVRFFEQVLELRAGDPPAGLDRARIQWMFDGAGRPLFHLSSPGSIDAAGGDIGRDTGALHHIALDCSMRPAMLARLDRLGLPYRCNDVASIGLQQVFVTEPNGILLELNFRDGPAAS